MMMIVSQYENALKCKNISMEIQCICHMKLYKKCLHCSLSEVYLKYPMFRMLLCPRLQVLGYYTDRLSLLLF